MANKKDSSGGPHPLQLTAIFAVFRAIAFAVVVAIFLKGSHDLYEERIAKIGEYDLGWVYLGLFLTNLTMLVLFLLNQSFRHSLNFPRPDQQLLKVVANWKKPEDKAIGFAVLEDDGLAGGFNRSGRAALNLGEYLPLIVAFVIANGFVFPFPIFVLCAVQLVGRTMYSIGYSSSAGGRILGFVMGSFSLIVLEMMALFIGLRSLGHLDCV